jgi:hypothetical protein
MPSHLLFACFWKFLYNFYIDFSSSSFQAKWVLLSPSCLFFLYPPVSHLPTIRSLLDIGLDLKLSDSWFFLVICSFCDEIACPCECIYSVHCFLSP